MIDWGEVRQALICERRVATATSASLRRFQRGQARMAGGTRNGKAVSIRIAELYAALKGYEQWLHGRESRNPHTSEKYEEIRRLVESVSLYEPKTAIYAAIEIERIHRPLLSFRQTFEYLMSEGRRQAREGYMSQGFAYCFMKAYDSL